MKHVQADAGIMENLAIKRENKYEEVLRQAYIKHLESDPKALIKKPLKVYDFRQTCFDTDTLNSIYRDYCRAMDMNIDVISARFRVASYVAYKWYSHGFVERSIKPAVKERIVEILGTSFLI